MKIRTLVAPDIRMHRLTAIGALLATLAAAQVLAQAPAPAPAAPAAATAAAAAPADELEDLVARIALYPDDLVAIILPASTNPLQIVQADRFLTKRKSDPKLPIDDKWDDAVKSLLNYPEVVTTMSADLDWTAALGEAVVADQGNVLAAVQAFRRRTQAAGNLKSDSKQVVVVEKEVITIAPADPQVIYVPQYNPTTVVTYGYSSWGYYPSPYPVYYYPYPPGAAFATGLIWGAAIGAAWGGNHYGTNWGGNANININNNTNINVSDRDRTNVNRGNNAGGGQKWSSNKQPGQVSRSVGSNPPARVGDSSRQGGGAGAGARPSNQGGIGTGGGAGAGRDGAGGARASTGAVGGAGAGAGAGASREAAGGSRAGGSHSGGSAFDGYGSGRSASMDSARGASSRSASAGAGHRSAGGRAGGGGGGRRR